MEIGLEEKMNEAHQATMTRLQEIKDSLAVVQENQQKMWRAIDRMTKEVQELVQGDIGTDGEEETEPVPVTFNLTKEETFVATKTSIFPH